jgi:hypothetical protein
MNQDALLFIMMVFVVVAAIALLIQAAMLFAMYKATKVASDQMAALLPRVRSLLENTETNLLPRVRGVLEHTETQLLPRVRGILETSETKVLPQVAALLETSKATLAESKGQIVQATARVHDVTLKADAIMELTREQMVKLDSVLSDATVRAKSQLDRAELVLDDTMSRVQESVAVMHSGVMKPLREIHGISAGIRAALMYLTRGSRPTVAQVTQDEEMFI